MENIETYERLMREVLSIPEDTDLKTLERGVTSDWDSVGHVALVTALEDNFDIMFEIEDILNFKTYDQGIEILKKYGVEF